MPTRLIIAYALIVLLVLFSAFLVWLNLSRAKRKRRHEISMRDRWLGSQRALRNDSR